MRFYSYAAAAALGAAILMTPTMPAFAAEQAPAAATQAAPVQVTLPYTYTSQQYGYTIQCPQKPVGVIPASALYEDKKGEVLIFDNDGYNIKYAWVVLTDAFDNKNVPDLNKLKESEAEKLLSGIMGSNGYEGIMLVNLNAKNKAIYAVTAKEVEIDEDGDGKVDGVAKADTQMAVAFFRTEKGNRYGVELIDNPDLRASSLAAFQKGITTLKDVDSKLSGDFLCSFLDTLVKAFAKDPNAAGGMEVLVAPDQAEKLAAYARAKLASTVSQGLKISPDRHVTAGMRIMLADGRIEHDFTDEAIMTAMSRLMSPALTQMIFGKA